MKKIILLTLLFAFSANSSNYMSCFKGASEKYNVPLNLLLSVAFTESSYNAKARNVNTNNSVDFGFMQINSIWKTEAKKHGFKWNDVKNNPCTNIKFGAKILRYNFERYESWLMAVGSYNAGYANTPKAKKVRFNYWLKVMKNMKLSQEYKNRLK